ncbi:ABC transporter substrate-binding protein [Soehngenia saccharolytica]|nr:ABC transporter substrate-binding protein [Soehngenia saccharolytica]
MKKNLSIALLLALTLLMTSCSTSNDQDQITVGIVQLADHPALDAAREGFVDGLKELDVDVKIVYQNAQGDIPTSLSIAQKFANDNVDLIYAIATPAAQSAKQATKDIPILFSAVTDPVYSQLVESLDKPNTNLTGTSDESPIKDQLQIFKQLNPDIRKIGILYNTSENNSEIQINNAKAIAKELNLEIVEKGVSNINEIPQAMDSLVKDIDGFYAITDNMIASAITVISQKLNENKIISVGAEEAHVKGGLLITKGISYYELGKQTASMAKKILVDGLTPSDIPVEKAKTISTVYNENTLKLLNIDLNNDAFKDAVAVKEGEI